MHLNTLPMMSMQNLIRKNEINSENEATETHPYDDDTDGLGINYLKYMPKSAYKPKVNHKQVKANKIPIIREGPYFLMRTRGYTDKQVSNSPRINPRWVAFWVTEVFYKLVVKLKK